LTGGGPRRDKGRVERSLSFLVDEGWPSDDGWPYTDADAEVGEIDPADPTADLDDDLVALHVTGSHLFDGLDQLERTVVAARFGLDGGPARTMRELQHQTGLPRALLRNAYGDGMAKVRTRLASDT
jgi:DNA-directed RNA polymerase sigma subunit (sigma70/sigma32)